MTTLGEIRRALGETIEAGVESDLYVYYNVPGRPILPALVIKPLSADFTKSFSLDDVSFEFQLFVLVSRVDEDEAQDDLDPFISHYGPNSIRRIIFENPSLGLDNVDALVYAMDGYGGSFDAAKVSHTGAILKVKVEFDDTEQAEAS